MMKEHDHVENPGLTIIRGLTDNPHQLGESAVQLRVSRLTLAKRRWRGTAEDGREFGFDLNDPMEPDHVFFRDGATDYIIVQEVEPVLEIPLAVDPSAAARTAWLLGNLHFPIEIVNGVIRVADDPATFQALVRERIDCRKQRAVFRPSGVAAHSHQTHPHNHHAH